MKFKKTLLAIALVAIAGIVVLPASAKTYSVHDSSVLNATKQTCTQMELVANTEIDELNQLIAQTQELKNSTNSMGSGSLVSLARATSELKLYEQLKAADMSLLNSVNQSMNLSQNLLSLWGSSNMSFDKFMETIANSSNQRDQDMVKLFQSTTTEMQQVAQRRQEILNKLGGAVGQTQAIQSLGALVDVLIGQNQQVIGMMTATAANPVAEKNEENARAEYAAKVMTDYQNRLKQAAESYK